MFYGFLVGLLASIGRKGYSFHKQMQMDRNIQDQIKEMHTPGNWVYQINGIYYGLNGQVLIPKREGDDIKYYFWRNGKDVYYASKRENDLNCENVKLKNRGCKFHLEYVTLGGGEYVFSKRICVENSTGKMFYEMGPGTKNGYYWNLVNYNGSSNANREKGTTKYFTLQYLKFDYYEDINGDRCRTLTRENTKLVPLDEIKQYEVW